MTIQRTRRRLAPIPFMDILNTRASSMLFGGGFAALGLLSEEYQLVLGSIPIMVGSYYWKDTKRLLKAFDRIPHATQVLLIGILALSTIGFCVMPADAAGDFFLSKACGLLDTIFSAGGGDVKPVQITINIIRAMFIIYLAIALIQVFNAMRQDEDWQMAVRAPVLAILVIVIVDIISKLVAGDAGGSC